jgi:hypothetical protein
MNYKDHLVFWKDSRQHCSLCGKSIHKDAERISHHCGRNTYGGQINFRLCSYCIYKLNESLDKESLRKEIERRVVDSI